AGGKTLALAALMAADAAGAGDGAAVGGAAVDGAVDGAAGHIIAADTDRRRLQQLPPRAERAGAAMVDICLLNPMQEHVALTPWMGRADVVLVDAPCSGTGTWRRNPEGRWRLTPPRYDRLRAEQSRLLDVAAKLVAPGGALVYAVCAITRGEGEEQVANFLARQGRGWRSVDAMATAGAPHGVGRSAGAGHVLTPLHDGTDGFFIARIERG
ncbi:MAG: RsmB/NOP family class I SAM-dependent RNA methyltransferase, partial [Sphingopyxis sp.]